MGMDATPPEAGSILAKPGEDRYRPDASPANPAFRPGRPDPVQPRRTTVVFDLGGVLIDWNPRHLYRTLFDGDEVAMEDFLATVLTSEWNAAQDAGRSFAEGTALLRQRHPDKAHLIDAYPARFNETLKGPIAGSVAILDALRGRGVALYALTNWSHETFPPALKRFDFLRWFRGILVSGEVGLIKPDARIYQMLLDRFGIDPASAVFIDDNPRNAAAATALGIHGIHFTTPAALQRDLEGLRLL
jgi:2-haloacid dehalogenase